eukprot:206813-Pelagomonas_calceolata.AAC.4
MRKVCETCNKQRDGSQNINCTVASIDRLQGSLLGFALLTFHNACIEQHAGAEFARLSHGCTGDINIKKCSPQNPFTNLHILGLDI